MNDKPDNEPNRSDEELQTKKSEDDFPKRVEKKGLQLWLPYLVPILAVVVTNFVTWWVTSGARFIVARNAIEEAGGRVVPIGYGQKVSFAEREKPFSQADLDRLHLPLQTVQYFSGPLAQFDLQDTNVNDKAFEMLAQFPIVRLHLKNTQVKGTLATVFDKTAPEFSNCRLRETLRHLYLTDRRDKGNQILDCESNIHHLRHLVALNGLMIAIDDHNFNAIHEIAMDNSVKSQEQEKKQLHALTFLNVGEFKHSISRQPKGNFPEVIDAEHPVLNEVQLNRYKSLAERYPNEVVKSEKRRLPPIKSGSKSGNWVVGILISIAGILVLFSVSYFLARRS